jgi:hypothetical protein
MTPIRLEPADRFREDRVDLPKQKSEIYLAAEEGEMPKEPKIDHEYHAGKGKMTITLHGYSLRKKSRDAIVKKVMDAVERSPDRLITDSKEKSKKGPGKKLPGHQKASKLLEEVGD